MAETFTFTLEGFHTQEQEILERRGIGNNKVQQFIDKAVLKHCQDYIPMDTGEIIRSGIRCTKIGSGEVKYNTPYARRWYYTDAVFSGAPKRGTYWFEHMKNEGGKNAILSGARRIAGAT